jgi:hypothetical protein
MTTQDAEHGNIFELASEPDPAAEAEPRSAGDTSPEARTPLLVATRRRHLRRQPFDPSELPVDVSDSAIDLGVAPTAAFDQAFARPRASLTGGLRKLATSMLCALAAFIVASVVAGLLRHHEQQRSTSQPRTLASASLPPSTGAGTLTPAAPAALHVRQARATRPRVVRARRPLHRKRRTHRQQRRARRVTSAPTAEHAPAATPDVAAASPAQAARGPQPPEPRSLSAPARASAGGASAANQTASSGGGGHQAEFSFEN